MEPKVKEKHPQERLIQRPVPGRKGTGGILKQSLILTILCIGFFVFLYPLSIWAISKVAAPNGGEGKIVESNGRAVGFENVGQSFTEDRYFYSRPSAVEYDGGGSGGSNHGPSNPEHLAEVQGRIDAFLEKNPTVKREEVPAELVTASGSGLDPHLSPQGALVQVERVAHVRNLPVEQVRALVQEQVEAPLIGVLGPEKVNVLKLNVALDQLDTQR
ncbi:K(+)-transporting ATPase subunit C [uncultured Pontibacter sp.]|uniref:K(+)-transporting ATPase subunit C n=1 Tax=uncultured Pontibacter sp. TaxID=453356 RepID=UPI002616296F|nr:K(+)-transporting ATPase subunit C [uncultured Pontibacter sp.]